jgi:RHH-type transcriptional regulator, rel operon repressor / antitoxin RelB
VRRSKGNKLEVVGVRLDPAIAHRLRLLASVTGRKQSVFLQQIIETGLGAIEQAHLPPQMLEEIRAGKLPPVRGEAVTETAPDLFGIAPASVKQVATRRPRARRRGEVERGTEASEAGPLFQLSGLQSADP